MNFEVTTFGAALLSGALVVLSGSLPAAVWLHKNLPTRKRLAKSAEVKLAVIETVVAEIKTDVSELKTDVREIRSVLLPIRPGQR